MKETRTFAREVPLKISVVVVRNAAELSETSKEVGYLIERNLSWACSWAHEDQ